MALVVMAGFLLLDQVPFLDNLFPGPVRRLIDRKAIWQDHGIMKYLVAIRLPMVSGLCQAVVLRDRVWAKVLPKPFLKRILI